MTTTAALKTFTFAPGLDLRSIDRSGEPWFVAADICMVLETQAKHVPVMVDSTDLSHFSVPGRRGRPALIVKQGECPGLPNRGVVAVNESGLYALILRSRKPEAKAFQKWVTGTVLPAIRKNGGYMTPEVAVQAIESPANFMARALLMAQETINGLQKQAEGMSPEAVCP